MNRKTSVGILIGAFVGLWGLAAQAVQFNVISLADDGSPGTLRYALNNAVLQDGDTISIQNAGTISITKALDVTKSITIRGTGAGSTIIDGNGSTRIFQIGGPSVTLSGMTLQKGQSPAADGGAILFQGAGTLNISGCDVSYNSAQNGGGIAFGGSQLWIYDSSITNNAASQNGGGLSLALMGGEVHITNTTIGLNVGTASGGGIAITGGGKGALINDTLSGNASASGGGISGGAVVLSVKNTIIAGNAGGNCAGSASSQGHNIDNEASCGLGDPTDMTVDPLLGPLQNNGGTTPTFALLSSSPAIDVADGAACPPDDQRSYVRPAGAACDIGAYEANASAPSGNGGSLGGVPGDSSSQGAPAQEGGGIVGHHVESPSPVSTPFSGHLSPALSVVAKNLAILQRCGNGHLDLPNEQCDDGNTVSNDGCSATCRLEYCGDGVVQSQSARGEQCDDGNNNNGDSCDSTCHFPPKKQEPKAGRPWYRSLQFWQ